MGVSNSELEQITLYEGIQNPFETKPTLECHYNTYRYGTKLGSSREYFTIDEHNNITNFAPVLSAGKLDKLKEIRCLIAEPPTLYEDFPVGVYLAAKVYVPKGSLNKYKNAPYWKNFWFIEEVDDKVTSITLPDAKDTLILGEEVTLNPVVEPDYAVNKKLRFSSSDSNVVSCNDAGELKAVGLGSATITISACDGSGVTLNHEVRVEESLSGIESIKSDNDPIFIRTGNRTLFIYNKPDNSIVRVFNLQGSLIKETEDSDVKNLAKGIYVITVEDKSFKVML